MGMSEFINENREMLINAIHNVVPNLDLDDDDIEMWVINDESLYNFAIESGVEV